MISFHGLTVECSLQAHCFEHESKACGAIWKAVEGLGGRVWLPEVD